MIFLLRSLGRKGQLQPHISSIMFKGIIPGNQAVEQNRLGRFFIRHLKIVKGTGVEIGPAIVSGIVAGDALIIYWPIPCNNPRSHCES